MNADVKFHLMTHESLNELQNSLAILKYSADILRREFKINEKLFNKKTDSWKSSPIGREWKTLLQNTADLLRDIDLIKSVDDFSIKPRDLRTYTDFANKINQTNSTPSDNRDCTDL